MVASKCYEVPPPTETAKHVIKATSITETNNSIDSINTYAQFHIQRYKNDEKPSHCINFKNITMEMVTDHTLIHAYIDPSNLSFILYMCT